MKPHKCRPHGLILIFAPSLASQMPTGEAKPVLALAMSAAEHNAISRNDFMDAPFAECHAALNAWIAGLAQCGRGRAAAVSDRFRPAPDRDLPNRRRIRTRTNATPCSGCGRGRQAKDFGSRRQRRCRNAALIFVRPAGGQDQGNLPGRPIVCHRQFEWNPIPAASVRGRRRLACHAMRRSRFSDDQMPYPGAPSRRRTRRRPRRRRHADHGS